ncbi:FMNH2-dependent dimethyl sulfone monooxygenase [Terribacillus halophilus]|uniref:FMNH2-dependent dimethyl sulfone monooxygenase n=1 Tax=Terribacillus halophilus TaxID=361279 RepID=A0A1G6HYG2_9BACI|nr:LLM class flavin-dependent oxidoreductase [Terribacillus halophilus]SDB99349.1 FMNH2-dependent dimethyl sulfone monooxygenase [Terribacillus halophilus]
MKYAYWQPVSNSWLRHVEDGGPLSLTCVQETAHMAENLGFDAVFLPDTYLYQGKNVDQKLDFWKTAGAIAEATNKLHIMAAVRPSIDQPAEAARQAVKIDEISNSRFSLAVVSFLREEERKRQAGDMEGTEEFYLQTEEFFEVLRGVWTAGSYTYDGLYYQVEHVDYLPAGRKKGISPLYAGGESDYLRQTIAETCDAYVMKGGTVQEVASMIADMQIRREAAGKSAFTEFGMTAYVICRETEEEAIQEWERITSADYEAYVTEEELAQKSQISDDAVAARGLRPNLVGTPVQIAQRILAYEHAGVSLLLLQFSPHRQEMERFANEIMPLVEEMRENSI